MPAPTLGQSQRSYRAPHHLATLASPPATFFKVPSAPVTFPSCIPRKAQANAYPRDSAHHSSIPCLLRPLLQCRLLIQTFLGPLLEVLPHRHCTLPAATVHPGHLSTPDQSPHSLVHSLHPVEWASTGPGPCLLALCLEQCLAHSGRSTSPCCAAGERPPCTGVATVWLSRSSSFPTRKPPSHCHSAVERGLSLEHRDFNPAPRLFSRASPPSAL